MHCKKNIIFFNYIPPISYFYGKLNPDANMNWILLAVIILNKINNLLFFSNNSYNYVALPWGTNSTYYGIVNVHENVKTKYLYTHREININTLQCIPALCTCENIELAKEYVYLCVFIDCFFKCDLRINNVCVPTTKSNCL